MMFHILFIRFQCLEYYIVIVRYRPVFVHCLLVFVYVYVLYVNLNKEKRKLKKKKKKKKKKKHLQGPSGRLKTSGFAFGFQHFPRDLANVNEWKIMFDPCSVKCSALKKPSH